jgi:hypothetical protein
MCREDCQYSRLATGLIALWLERLTPDQKDWALIEGGKALRVRSFYILQGYRFHYFK